MIFSSTYYTYLMLFTSIVHPRTLLPLYRPEDHSSSQFVPINVPLFFLSPPHYSIEEHKHLETKKKKKTKWMHNSTMSRWKEEKSRRDNRDHLHKTTITNENYHTKPNKTITKTKQNETKNKTNALKQFNSNHTYRLNWDEHSTHSGLRLLYILKVWWSKKLSRLAASGHKKRFRLL